ncbi:MAG: single-stranded-DNA-specific exonuclease RecJ [Patescibacteria group bacterium]
MNKTWNIKPKKFDDPIIQLLYNRGIIKNAQDPKIESFLNPEFNRDFFDPGLLPNFDKAIKRLQTAIDGGEKIGIYADYDADGIPGAALLFRALQKFGLNPIVYIPTRQNGYGFNQQGLDFLISGGCSLIVSIDLGIREIEFSKYIKKKNVDLIITDHHEPGDELPEALAIINPKISSSKYPFKELSGAGVIYKVLQGLSKIYPKMIGENFLKWNLDLVAISTISDVVPLISENRLIAKFGLIVLRKSKNLGLRQLYKVSAINQEKIDAYNVGFQIGPRINAPGRLDHATASFNLLVTEDISEAEENARHLQKQNEERQLQMDKIFNDAVTYIEKKKLAENKIIIIKDKNWAKGVIGPVASQLVEKYNRPAVILSESGEVLDGSCRSISGFDIVEALEATKKYLVSFGGHKAAAGLHLEKNKFDGFSQSLIKFANEKISDKDILPAVNIDLEIRPEKITLALLKKMEKLEPFGLGNSRPVFVTRGLQLSSHRLVGRDDKHLQLRFKTGLGELKGIIFNHDIKPESLSDGNRYDIVYQPQINFWNGKNWIDLRILDIRSRTDDELSNNQ